MQPGVSGSSFSGNLSVKFSSDKNHGVSYIRCKLVRKCNWAFMPFFISGIILLASVELLLIYSSVSEKRIRPLCESGKVVLCY